MELTQVGARRGGGIVYTIWYDIVLEAINTNLGFYVEIEDDGETLQLNRQYINIPVAFQHGVW